MTALENQISPAQAGLDTKRLTHVNAHLERYVDDEAFRVHATFELIPGLADPRWITFRARSLRTPGAIYLRHVDLQLHAEMVHETPDAPDTLFARDATFFAVPF